MAEIKKLWMVRDVGPKFDIYDPTFWGDSPTAELPDEEQLLSAFSYLAEGYSIDEFVRIVMGSHKDWWHENTKVYGDASSARSDAMKRLKKAKAKHDRLTGKTASLTLSVIERFKNG